MFSVGTTSVVRHDKVDPYLISCEQDDMQKHAISTIASNRRRNHPAAPGQAATSAADHVSHSQQYVSQQENVGLEPIDRCSLAFLLNYTSPETTSLADVPGTTLFSDPLSGQTFKTVPDSSHLASVMPQTSYCSSVSGGQSSHLREIDPTEESYPTEEVNAESNLDLYNSDLEKTSSTVPGIRMSEAGRPLPSSCGKIGHALADELISFSANLDKVTGDTASTVGAKAACSLLLSGNISTFIGCYFAHWHHHSPVIHRGTFSVATSSLPLLITILLTGALLSPNKEDNLRASHSLDLVERYVFEHVDFQRLLNHPVSQYEPLELRSLNVLQAALLIVQIQLRSESLQKRDYTRRTRFSQLVDGSRALGIHRSEKPYKAKLEGSNSFDWHRFGLAEAGTRLLYGIFNLDASFSIFFDMEPRVKLKEVTFGLPCSLNAFVASDSDECIKSTTSEVDDGRMNAIEILDRLRWGDSLEVEKLIKQLDILHLFILILGLLQLMWLLEPDELRNELKISLSTALQRWKEAWKYQMSSLSQDDVARYGLSRNAAIEFWNLATFMVGKGYTRLSNAALRGTGRAEKEHTIDWECHTTLKRIAGHP